MFYEAIMLSFSTVTFYSSLQYDNAIFLLLHFTSNYDNVILWYANFVLQSSHNSTAKCNVDLVVTCNTRGNNTNFLKNSSKGLILSGFKLKWKLLECFTGNIFAVFWQYNTISIMTPHLEVLLCPSLI